MSLQARKPADDEDACDGCAGGKGAPLCVRVDIGSDSTLILCEECARDVANAIGFFAIRDGGWSKLEPRKRRAKP